MNDINVDDLYEELPSAFSISETDQKLIKDSGGSPTYGELTSEGIERILSNINTNFTNLIDLGSGAGKVCLNSCLYEETKKIVGIELSIHRHNISKQAQDLLLNKQHIEDFIEDYCQDELPIIPLIAQTGSNIGYIGKYLCRYGCFC